MSAEAERKISWLCPCFFLATKMLRILTCYEARPLRSSKAVKADNSKNLRHSQHKIFVVIDVLKLFQYHNGMTTNHRFRNKYRLQLREKYHEPMHVHLVGGDVNAKFDLVTLALIAGHAPADLKKEVLEWLRNNRAALIEEWKTWQQ